MLGHGGSSGDSGGDREGATLRGIQGGGRRGVGDQEGDDGEGGKGVGVMERGQREGGDGERRWGGEMEMGEMGRGR